MTKGDNVGEATAPVPSPNWTHPGVVVRVIDGDTLVVRLDLGRYGGGDVVEHTTTIRIAGLYCPELGEPGGEEARDFAKSIVGGADVMVQTRKPNPRDAYGRVVADVWIRLGRSFAEEMIEADHGSATP
jgi:endonuclease YncB( thermonuclease family)